MQQLIWCGLVEYGKVACAYQLSLLLSNERKSFGNTIPRVPICTNHTNNLFIFTYVNNFVLGV